MEKLPEEGALEIASFRYRIIAPAIDAERQGVVQALREAAVEGYVHPHGHPVRFSLRTLWRWLQAYRRGGVFALCPAPRKDKGSLRAFKPELLERVQQLRRERPSRSTKTLIDILERENRVAPATLARSTLDRHLDRLGLSRRTLHRLGQKTFRRIETQTPFELLLCDFHHGPYVRHGSSPNFRRALLCDFLDHFSRFVPEARYYLHEDFAALRFGFRKLLLAFGLPLKLYVDNGPSYQAARFHAACEALGIRLVHSKPYTPECRGALERFHRTVKEQFEAEVRAREEPLTLDELNGFFEAWLAERYHRSLHSETGQTPLERFARTAQLRLAPALSDVDELLRLRLRRSVHKKWSTVEVDTIRYLVNPALRGRKIDVLHDPFDPQYVLVVHQGRLVQRAYPQNPGETPPQPLEPSAAPSTDYLALLQADFEKRVHAELASLRLRPSVQAAELSLVDLTALVERCRGQSLTESERSQLASFWRKMRPLDATAARAALEAAHRRLGSRLHPGVYLDALNTYLIHLRTKGVPKP